MSPTRDASLPRNPFRLGLRSPHIRPLFPEPSCQSRDAESAEIVGNLALEARIADPQAPGTSVDQPLHFHVGFADKYNARAVSRCRYEDYGHWRDNAKEMYKVHKNVSRKVQPPVRTSSLRKSDSPRYDGSICSQGTGDSSSYGSRFESDNDSLYYLTTPPDVGASTHASNAEEEIYIPPAGLSFPPPPMRPQSYGRSSATALNPPLPNPPPTHATSAHATSTHATPSNDRADIYEALTALDDALDAVSVNSSSGVHSTCSSLCSSSGTGGGASLSNYGSDTHTGTTVTPATLRKPMRADYACVLETRNAHVTPPPPNVTSIPPPPLFAAPSSYIPPHHSTATATTTPAFLDHAPLPSPPAHRQLPPTLPKSTPTPTSIETHAISTTPTNPTPPQTSNRINNSNQVKMPSETLQHQEIDVTTLAGYQSIPDNCPSWRVAMLNRKNEQLLQDEVERIKVKQEEDKKWQGVPDWKKSLRLDKQKKLQEKKEPEALKRQEQMIQEEKLKAMPNWKQELIVKKSS